MLTETRATVKGRIHSLNTDIYVTNIDFDNLYKTL